MPKRALVLFNLALHATLLYAEIAADDMYIHSLLYSRVPLTYYKGIWSLCLLCGHFPELPDCLYQKEPLSCVPIDPKPCPKASSWQLLPIFFWFCESHSLSGKLAVPRPNPNEASPQKTFIMRGRFVLQGVGGSREMDEMKLTLYARSSNMPVEVLATRKNSANTHCWYTMHQDRSHYLFTMRFSEVDSRERVAEGSPYCILYCY